MINYYFDEQGIELLINQEAIKVFPYTHNLPASPNTITPDNALRVLPEFKAKFQPILNEAQDGWTEIPDHRQQKDEQDRIIEGSGTPYYLPEDNYQSEAKYMTEFGSLPKNALLIKPVKTLGEGQEEKIAEIKQKVIAEETSGFVVIEDLGFRADATRKSKDDVDGIIQSMIFSNAASIPFRDYDNAFHTLSLEQVKILQMAIINKGLLNYQHKWELEALIARATTVEAVEAIIW